MKLQKYDVFRLCENHLVGIYRLLVVLVSNGGSDQDFLFVLSKQQ